MAFSIRKHRKVQINDLPKEVLQLIFNDCCPVTRGRARAVCSLWRKVLDDVDEDHAYLNGSGHARLMICDRRRAILEKFIAPPCCSYAISDIVGVRKAKYYKDTFAPSTLTAHAFSFDLSCWTSNFDITEVWLTNFGSFLERDQKPHENSPLFASGGASTKKGLHKPGSYGATPPIDTTGTRYGRTQIHRSEGSTINPMISTTTVSAYNLLPSSQKASLESLDGVAELTKEMCEELRGISAGRFERLAGVLKDIQPLNITFNDHSFYQKRPTLLLFWLPNIRKLTFDNIQGVQSVELHKVISLKGLDELTIKQPKEKACIIISDTLLASFLEVDRKERRKFRLRFEGKNATSIKALLLFIKKWQSKSDIVPFHTILVDALAVNPADFVRAALEPEDCNNNQVMDKKKEAALCKKQLTFRHRRSKNHSIKFKYEDGYLMFYYCDAKNPPKLPEPVKETGPKIVTFTSVSNKTLAEEEEEERLRQEKENKSNGGGGYASSLRRLLGSFSSFTTVRTTA
uniref:F-box domain-containing protein n=1 Tax=Syphacia muris TaxID=451379 RepID=A0A0N5ATL7_9BILA